MQQRITQEEPFSSTFLHLEKSRGLAIASLVIGVISCVTLGFGGLGSLTGLTLGIVALYKIRKHPDRYDGGSLAVAGIVTSVLSIIITVAVVSVWLVGAVRRYSAEVVRRNEIAAAHRLYTIGQMQSACLVTQQRFLTLEELRSGGMIDHEAEADGYRYVVRIEGDSFEAHAMPETYGSTGRYSFYVRGDSENGESYVHGGDHRGGESNVADPIVGTRRYLQIIEN